MYINWTFAAVVVEANVTTPVKMPYCSSFDYLWLSDIAELGLKQVLLLLCLICICVF